MNGERKFEKGTTKGKKKVEKKKTKN